MPRRKRMLSLQKRNLELRSSLLRLGRLIKIIYPRINATFLRFPSALTAKCTQYVPFFERSLGKAKCSVRYIF